jgi:hypothetical protein
MIWQQARAVHPYTCCSHNGCKSSEQKDFGALIPWTNGWSCPCGAYEQNWCQGYACEMPTFEPLSSVVRYLMAKGTLSNLLAMYTKTEDENMQLDSYFLMTLSCTIQDYAMKLMRSILEYENRENNERAVIEPEK